MEVNLKSILKSIKLNESVISMALGVLVIIVVGILVVNYFKGQDKGNILTTSSTTSETQNLTGSTSTGTNSHTVTKGETLWSIAEKAYGNGGTWQKIAEANSIKNAKALKVGQVLTIPVNQVAETGTLNQNTVSQPKAASKTVATINQNLSREPITAATYKVVRGDNLWNISVRAYGNGNKWTTIATANHLAHPRLIHAGNILILPR